MLKTPGLCSCGQIARRKSGSMCSSCEHFTRLEKLYGKSIIDKKRKLEPCPNCGFKPLHHCQMDIDHSNGNNADHSPKNLQLICSNCHRIKTHLCKDNLKRYNKT